MRVPPGVATAARIASPLTQAALRSSPMKNAASNFLERYFPGPTSEERSTMRSFLWARAINREGTAAADAWMETCEAYRYTAEISVRAVEKVVEWHPIGALTPSQAFGADFALEVEGTVRLDRLG
jgi:short subunit dehydrogenase-like uncharacterized protein